MSQLRTIIEELCGGNAEYYSVLSNAEVEWLQDQSIKVEQSILNKKTGARGLIKLTNLERVLLLRALGFNDQAFGRNKETVHRVYETRYDCKPAREEVPLHVNKAARAMLRGNKPEVELKFIDGISIT